MKRSLQLIGSSLVFLIVLVEKCTPARDETPKSLFSDLSMEEMDEVNDYLYQQSDLHLRKVDQAKVKDSYIFMIEALRPNKSDALQYLDASGPLPQREARVVIFRGDLQIPVVEEYKVFPIPNPTKHHIINIRNRRRPIPFSSRPPLSLPQHKEVTTFLEVELSKVKEILAEATGYTFYSNCTERCLTWVPGIPPYVEPNHCQVMFNMLKAIEGGDLHPIGLEILVNMDEADSKKWSVDYVWFQGKHFRDLEHLLEVISIDNLEPYKIDDTPGLGDITLSSSLNFRGDPRPEELARGPRSYMPDGNRFSVSGRRIKWLGWEFEFSMLSSSGIQIHDVRFLQERIAYELSLQEIGVFYGGGSPAPAHSTYYDSFTSIGHRTSELFAGIDCPDYAQFFDFVHYKEGKPEIFKRGACLFEQDIGVPLRRHYVPGVMAHGMAGNALVFRHALTVFNYDYVLDFMFHQGGQIEVKAILSGYALTSFYTGPEMDPHGHIINVPTAIGNMHHHVLNIKADLDILGRQNRFHTLDISLKEENDLLNNGHRIYNRVFKKNLRSTEKDAAYKFNFETPKYLVFSNELNTNKFGYPRGYRLLSEGMSKMLLPDDYRGGRSRSWTKYQVAVTKQKDDEKSSSIIYATSEPFDPVMSFDDFIEDDENIVDEDLVAWITLGTHHIPHSEDVPIVLTPGLQLRFYLLPYNYFDEDPSLASRDNIKVTPDNKGGLKYHFSGFSDDPTVPSDTSTVSSDDVPVSSSNKVADGILIKYLALVLVMSRTVQF